jgi:ABC-2 type transport system permease protein
VAAARAIARRAFADGRARTASFALLFGLVALVQVTGYEHSFPTLKDRLDFAHSFGDNKAVRLFYGVPHDLLSVGGYVSWRVGGILTIFAAMWGLLAAVRALRTEEEAGRQELVLAGAVRRSTAFVAPMVAVAAGVVVLWTAALAGLLVGGLAAGESAYLALATVSPALVFVGLGALASQLAASRRVALEIGTAALGLALALRIVADTTSSLEFLRWVTPLGWSEEMRAFTGSQPGVLVLPLLASAALLVAAAVIARGRDVGSGLIATRDSRAPRLGLLSSATAQALRGERGSLAGWLVGIGFFAVVFGLLSDTFATAHLSAAIKEELKKLGGATIVTPSGALGFYFLFFVLAIGLFCCAQIAALRREESDQRLETLLSLPVGRVRWLGGRLALAVLGSVALALAAGLLAWAGAATQGVGVSLPDMLGAGANCLPAALLFLAIGMLAFAVVPRASAGITYGLVSVAFVWELFGALLDVPAWTLDLSPFHRVGLVPAQPFKATAAAVMLALAAAAALGAIRIFRRRDVVGA